jgi:hypothetical protein
MPHYNQDRDIDFMATSSSTISTGIQSTNVSTREELIQAEFSDRVIIVDEGSSFTIDAGCYRANDALTSIVRIRPTLR